MAPANPWKGSCRVTGWVPGRQNWPWASPAAASGLVAQAKVCRPGSRGADRKVLHQSPGGWDGSLTTAGTAWSQTKVPSPALIRPGLAGLLPRTLTAVPPGGLWVGRPAHGPQLGVGVAESQHHFKTCCQMEVCWLPSRGPDRCVSLWSPGWQDCSWTGAQRQGHFRMESETECGKLDSGPSRSQLSGAGARSLSHSVVHCTGQAKVRGCSLVQEDELFLGL